VFKLGKSLADHVDRFGFELVQMGVRKGHGSGKG